MDHKRLQRYAYPAAVCILFILVFGSIAQGVLRKKREPVSKTGLLLDTVIGITLYDHKEEDILDGAFDLVGRYEGMMSPTIADSEIYKLNHRPAGTRSVSVSEDVAEVLFLGLRYAELTEGAFDPTVLPLSELWDFKSETHVLPSAEALEKALERVGYKRISVDGSTVFFADDDVTVDPGAVAKGYIADRIKDYLVSRGVESAIINLGGNILCVGEKPDGSAFRIGIQRPFGATQEDTAMTVEVRDESAVSSGVYERCFELGGVNYHHILDPSTGMPYRNGIAGVTVIGPSSAECDALSTSVFCLGLEKGSALLNASPGYTGYFVLDDGTICRAGNK